MLKAFGPRLIMEGFKAIIVALAQTAIDLRVQHRRMHGFPGRLLSF